MLRAERATPRGGSLGWSRISREQGERHAARVLRGKWLRLWRLSANLRCLCDVIAPALFREKQVSEFLSKFGDAQPPGPRHRRTGTLCAAVITLRTEAGSVIHFASAIYIRAMATSAAVGIDGPAPIRWTHSDAAMFAYSKAALIGAPAAICAAKAPTKQSPAPVVSTG
jgi:hypothetical protein